MTRTEDAALTGGDAQRRTRSQEETLRGLHQMVRRRPESDMPTDMALPLFLSKEDFLCRSGPHPPKAPLSSGPEPGKVKKRVTFADCRGLALTRVKVFSQFSDPIFVPPAAAAAAAACAAPPQEEEEEERLVLDFPQPSSDYLLFHQSLERNQVCLERCVLKERELSGSVKVKNLSFQKSVRLRVTLDGWESHREVECVYAGHSYSYPPPSRCDRFSFALSLPPLRPPQRVEFAVRYVAESGEYWDSNHGRNYAVLCASSSAAAAAGQASRPEPAFGGSRLLPDWPSYAGYEHLGPYY